MASTDTTTRRLTVNAAFLKDIKDDNRELNQVWDQLNPLLEHQQMVMNHWPEILELLAALRDQLAFHFALEEAYGYFDEAIVNSPQLSINAECLRAQHAQLFAQICELSDKAMEVSADSSERVERFLKKFDMFCKEFAKHEEAELQLILDGLDDDIGVGD